MELAERFAEGPVKRASQMFYVWGHSYEFDNDDNWDVIEKFAQYIGGRDDIWYATNIEVFDYVKAYERLVRSYDDTMVYNPSAIDVWFEINGEAFCIKAGETLAL